MQHTTQLFCHLFPVKAKGWWKQKSYSLRLILKENIFISTYYINCIIWHSLLYFLSVFFCDWAHFTVRVYNKLHWYILSLSSSHATRLADGKEDLLSLTIKSSSFVHVLTTPCVKQIAAGRFYQSRQTILFEWKWGHILLFYFCPCCKC